MTSASQPLSEALIAAYLATRYVASSDQGQVVLAIDLPNPSLAALMRRHSFASGCFITACNPFGQFCPDAENYAANASLRAALVTRQWVVFDGSGTGADGDWPPEPSFLVLGPDRATAAQLCAEWRQNAVVWFDSDAIPRLLFHPALGVEQ